MQNYDPNNKNKSPSFTKTVLVKLFYKVVLIVLLYMVAAYMLTRFYTSQSTIHQGNVHTAAPTDNKINGPLNVEGLTNATNRERHRYKLNVLKNSELLNKSASLKCQDMIDSDYWSHDSPDGQEPWHFFKLVGYQYSKAGENLAYGYKTNAEAINGWMNSKEHRDNIINPDFTEVGFAICSSNNFTGRGQQVILVQHFGRPLTTTTQ